jgi:hypothetical protein
MFTNNETNSWANGFIRNHNEHEKKINKIRSDFIKVAVDHLVKHSKVSLKKNRIRKKFFKDPQRYVPKSVFKEYFQMIMSVPLIGCRGYGSIGEKLIKVDALPQKGYYLNQ